MKLVCFDCDSTLSAIEGIDELGRACGPEVFARVEAMTAEAMNGKIPLEAVFAERLKIIHPTLARVESLGRAYLDAVEPTAQETVRALRQQGWTPCIISAGFTIAIRPLARFLGIDQVEAVDLEFDASGEYRGFDSHFPATRSGGKPLIVRRLKEKFAPSHVIAVGDGVSDLETKPEVDLFVGFGRYCVRPRVEHESGAFIRSLAELPSLAARFG